MTKPEAARRLVVFASLALLLAGCQTIRYEYTPPTSDQGRLCITHCAGIRENCRGNEMQRAQWEMASCEQHSEFSYRTCLSQAITRNDGKRCFRSSCWAHENTWRCDEGYRQCFVGCGGTIRTFKE